MNSGPSAWISILQLLWLPFYIASLVYIRRQASDGGYAKTLATLAVCLMTTSYVGGQLTMRVFVRYFSPTAFGNLQAICVAATSLLSMLAVSMLIAAVFTGRAPQAASRRLSEPVAPQPGGRTDSSNPYSPPSG